MLLAYVAVVLILSLQVYTGAFLELLDNLGRKLRMLMG